MLYLAHLIIMNSHIIKKSVLEIPLPSSRLLEERPLTILWNCDEMSLQRFLIV